MLIEPLHLAANKSESIIESTGRWWSASSDSNHSIQQTRSSDQKSQPVHWADETNGSKVNQTAQTSHSQGKETANDNNNNNNGHNKRTAKRKRKREKEKKEKKRIKKNKKEQERTRKREGRRTSCRYPIWDPNQPNKASGHTKKGKEATCFGDDTYNFNAWQDLPSVFITP